MSLDIYLGRNLPSTSVGREGPLDQLLRRTWPATIAIVLALLWGCGGGGSGGTSGGAGASGASTGMAGAGSGGIAGAPGSGAGGSAGIAGKAGSSTGGPATGGGGAGGTMANETCGVLTAPFDLEVEFGKLPARSTHPEGPRGHRPSLRKPRRASPSRASPSVPSVDGHAPTKL